MDIIAAKNLRKSFHAKEGKVMAVNNVSLTIKKGEFFGLLGVNGAGKSTLINILSGLTSPDSGTLRLFGQNFTDHEEAIKQRCNVATAYYGLSQHLTVWENLRVFALLYQQPVQKINRLADYFMLNHLLGVKIRSLSSGERSRANIVKALLNDPEILFLDECTAGLDPHIAEVVRDYLREYHQKHHCTIIFTSHNMPEVEQLCQRIAFMSQGKIVKIGTASQLVGELEVQTVHLTITKKMAAALALLQRSGLKPTVQGNHLFFSLVNRKNMLYTLLRRLVHANIAFEDIRLEKPTLQDYFIHHARKT